MNTHTNAHTHTLTLMHTHTHAHTHTHTHHGWLKASINRPKPPQSHCQAATLRAQGTGRLSADARLRPHQQQGHLHGPEYAPEHGDGKLQDYVLLSTQVVPQLDDRLVRLRACMCVCVL